MVRAIAKGRGTMVLTFDPERWRVAACLHHTAEEDRDVRYLALGEDGKVLDKALTGCEQYR